MWLLPFIVQAFLIAHNNGYFYGNSETLPPCSDRKISCDRLMALAFWLAGYTDQTVGGITVMNMEPWLLNHGWKKNTDPNKVRAGHIVLMYHNSYPNAPHAWWHTFYVTAFRSVNDIDKYDCGSKERIDSEQPFKHVPLNQWVGERSFYCSFYFEEKKLPDNWESLQGADRYATSAAVIKKAFSKPESVVLVSGENFPDALSAFSYAGVKKCPVLLTQTYQLSTDTYYLLKEWNSVKSVTVIGKALKGSCVGTLIDLGVERINVIGGDDRQKTAEAVCEAVLNVIPDTAYKCVVCSGDSPADAVSISPWAFKERMPVLLTRNGKLSDKSKELVKRFSVVYIVGGENAVNSDNVTHIQPIRLSGADRYETSVAVANNFVSNYKGVCVVRGENDYFADALSAGSLAGVNESPIILISDDSTATYKYLNAIKGSVRKGYVIGSANNDKAKLIESLE